MEEEKIIDILVSEHYISDKNLENAKREAAESNSSVLEILYSQDVITKDLVGQAIAEYYKVKYADLNSNMPSPTQVLKIPESVARNNRAVLFQDDKSHTIIATDDPSQKGLLASIKRVLKAKKISIAYSLPEDIKKAFMFYRKPLSERMDAIAKQGDHIAPKLVDTILNDAVALRASDVHMEPQSGDVVIRFRIDGIMQIVGKMSRENYESVINRIKVMAHLRTDQHAVAQDGSIRHMDPDNGTVDIRVSIVPIFDGEKIVLRLLASYARSLSLSSLGLSKSNSDLVLASGNKPFGMVLVVGPTGSGKTTSLYGLMKLLNKPEINITTIEDPVEYKIQGVNHIQVSQNNTDTSLTFAKGLRSIVRQDPDIILVGEIRDKETAEIAVNAALTGHMLLSTFHSNDATTAITRLFEMGVEPFQLSSTLEAVIGQRLLRKICESCRFSVDMTQKQIAEIVLSAGPFFKTNKNTVFKGRGCLNCAQTGYSGRTAVFEIIQMTNELRTLIVQRPTAQEIWNLARQQGAQSMFEDAIEKVKQGITTIEEVRRVVTPPNDLLILDKSKYKQQKVGKEKPSRKSKVTDEKKKAKKSR